MSCLKKSVFVMLLCLPVLQLVLAQDSASCDQEGMVQAIDRGECAKRYRLCSNSKWVNAMCVGSNINTTTHQCQRPFPHCPQEDLVPLLSRGKRQADGQLDCSHAYRCPSNVKELFIYPVWSSPSCDSFVMCQNGQSVVSSCKNYGLDFYNPRRLSCESLATPTNTCVFRLKTDIGPIQ